MIELIAQTTQTAAPGMSTSAMLLGGVALAAGARILLILEGELNSSQPVMSDPVKFALKATATHAELSANKWRGLRAVVVALQLENYIKRFGLFVKTQLGYGLCLICMAVFLALFVWTGKDAPDSLIQESVVKVTGACFILWTLLIEKCKAMKKAVELLRVT